MPAWFSREAICYSLREKGTLPNIPHFTASLQCNIFDIIIKILLVISTVVQLQSGLSGLGNKSVNGTNSIHLSIEITNSPSDIVLPSGQSLQAVMQL